MKFPKTTPMYVVRGGCTHVSILYEHFIPFGRSVSPCGNAPPYEKILMLGKRDSNRLYLDDLVPRVKLFQFNVIPFLILQKILNFVGTWVSIPRELPILTSDINSGSIANLPRKVVLNDWKGVTNTSPDPGILGRFAEFEFRIGDLVFVKEPRTRER